MIPLNFVSTLRKYGLNYEFSFNGRCNQTIVYAQDGSVLASAGVTEYYYAVEAALGEVIRLMSDEIDTLRKELAEVRQKLEIKAECDESPDGKCHCDHDGHCYWCDRLLLGESDESLEHL